MPRWGTASASRRSPRGAGSSASWFTPAPPLSFFEPHPPAPFPPDKGKKIVKTKSEASLLFHKLVSDKRLSCCAVESSMSEIRARRARQLQQIASLVGLTEKFRPAAR